MPGKNAETMISAVYYIFLVLLCTFFMILSALALVVCYPFDKGRRVVHELSRILCAPSSPFRPAGGSVWRGSNMSTGRKATSSC